MTTVGIVPSVISCEKARRSRPRPPRRGTTGGIGIAGDEIQIAEIKLKSSRRSSKDGASTSPSRPTNTDVLGAPGDNTAEHEGILFGLDVSRAVLEEPQRNAKTTTEQQRRHSCSNIRPDVGMGRVEPSDSSNDCGRHSQSIVTQNLQPAADRSGRSAKSSQSLEHHRAFTSSHRAANNATDGNGHTRGNSPTSSPTITPSETTTKRRNSGPRGTNVSRSKLIPTKTPKNNEKAASPPQEDGHRANEAHKIEASIDPRELEIEDLRQVAKSSRRSIDVLANEIRMLKKVNKQLTQDMNFQQETCQQEIEDLKNELRACYKKNITLSKSSKADTAAIERLELDLEKRDATIATLQDALAALE